MKEGWTYKKLGEVCDILDSQRKPITKNKRESGSIPYYGATGLLDYVKDYIFDEKLVLLGEDGAKWGAGENSAYIIEGKAWVNNHAHALRPQRELLLDELLVYYLNFSNLLSYITGVTVPKLNQEKMRSIEIPIGPIKEQQSIVDYLDSAFAKIDAMKANAEKALNEAKALFQASLKEMLEPKEGWEEKKIKDICETVTDFVAAGSFAGLRENVVYNSEKDYAQLVRTTDLKSGFSKGGYVYVNEHAFNYLYRVNLNEECVILPNVGVNCGEVYYVTPSILPYNNNVLGPNAVLVRSKNYSNHFLSYLFLGNEFQTKLGDITSHMAQPKFNKTGLKEIEISVPPLSEQQRIVDYLDSLKSKVDRLQENYDKISQECDALKQAILRQVFE